MANKKWSFGFAKDNYKLTHKEEEMPVTVLNKKVHHVQLFILSKCLNKKSSMNLPIPPCILVWYYFETSGIVSHLLHK